MSISKNNCLYKHADLVGAVQDATLKNYHKVSASHVSKSRKEDLGYDKFSSNMKYLLAAYPSYEKISVNNLAKKVLKLKAKTEKKSEKELLQIPDLLVKAVISYRSLYQEGATEKDMASLLEKEDFHPFLAQDLSEYMKREFPVTKKSSKKAGTSKTKSKTKAKETKAKETKVKETKAKDVKEKESNAKTAKKQKASKKNKVVESKVSEEVSQSSRLYEVTLRDGTINYIAGQSILVALGLESAQKWDILTVREMGNLYT